jgi:DNA-binding NarL/FixJ family response regulator
MAEQTVSYRVLLADDHVTVRHGLRLLIDGQPDMKVVAEASDGAAAVQRAIDAASEFAPLLEEVEHG